MTLIHASTQWFFRKALEEQEVGLTDLAMVYVVHLLSDFTSSEELYAGSAMNEKPCLVDYLSRASTSGRSEQARIYKHVGDMSLFFSGIFPESLHSKSYYIGVGGSAYGAASSLVREKSVAVVFTELSDRFADVADALALAL